MVPQSSSRLGTVTFKTLSIIIPVYNEERSIGTVLERVANADSLGLKKEIIVVDDGSKDGSKFKIQSSKLKIQKKYPSIQIKTIFKKKNQGKGAVVRDGIMNSTGDIALIQDADLEYDPNDYPLLLEAFFTYGVHVVYGSRFITDKPHRVLYFWHYVANTALTFFSNMLTNLNLSDIETGFKVFRGDLIRFIGRDLKSRRFGFEPEITARIARIRNIKIYEVGISYHGRTYAEGKKIKWYDAVRAFWEIIQYNLFSR